MIRRVIMADMIFKAEGFVNTEEPENYVCELTFQLEKDTDTLCFEFYGEGKPIYFNVKDPGGLVRVQQMGTRSKRFAFLDINEQISGSGTCPGKIQKGEWKIIAFAFGARTTSRLGKVNFAVKVFDMGTDDSLIRDLDWMRPPSGDIVSWLDRNELEKGKIVLKDFESPEPVKTGSKWLKGDFHAHTFVSDGSASPQELLDEGFLKKLDFFFITEHGILTTGFPEKKGINVFPGYEVTTALGHFNVLGLKSFPEDILYKGPSPDLEYIEKMISGMKKRGALISINHPFFNPWQWIYNGLSLALIDSIEIVTDPNDVKIGDTNETAIRMIDLLWNEGYRITGIGGSDSHTAFSESQLGQPLTEVYAVKGSLNSLLEGVKRQRAAIYLDTDCRIRCGLEGKEIIPGTEIKTGDDINLVISAEAPDESEPLLLRIVENGSVTGEHEIVPGNMTTVEKKWSAKSDWIRCELRDKYGRIRGFINPIYRGRRSIRSKSIKSWGDAVKLLGV